MKLYNCEKVPDGYHYDFACLDEFNEDDIEHLHGNGIDVAWYWYVSGNHEGSGQLLMMKEGRFYAHDCGHCSCYGPTTHITLDAGSGTLAELASKCSAEVLKELQPLINMAMEQGYE